MADISVELFRKIRRIQIQTARFAQDMLSGMYRSAFRGRGMEFEEVREYQPGDEVRSIDWNVTARIGHPYVKNYREERELTVMLMVDISSSARFGSRNCLKSEMIAEIGAVFAFSAIKNQDKVGLILFTDRVEKYIPPKKGVRHVTRVIRDLLAYEPLGEGTNLGDALSYLGNVQPRSTVCFLISDFLCDENAHQMAITSMHHDLIAIRVTDPSESTFPKVGLIQLADLESGESVLIDSSNKTVRRHFEEASQAKRLQLQALINKLGAGLIDLSTGSPYMPPIQKFFKLRQRKRR